jgi:hypothetical protein
LEKIMAKVSGPLMSMDASGKFGGALVFANRLGTKVVRQLVAPANPQSADQETARNYVRACGDIQRQTNTTAEVLNGETLTDKERLAAQAPTGQTWNGYLVGLVVGVNAINAVAADAIWSGLIAGEKTAWDDAAAARDVPFHDVAQKSAGGTPATSLTAGQVYLRTMYGLYMAGLYTLPDATPPTYA